MTTSSPTRIQAAWEPRSWAIDIDGRTVAQITRAETPKYVARCWFPTLADPTRKEAVRKMFDRLEDAMAWAERKILENLPTAHAKAHWGGPADAPSSAGRPAAG